ncbi:putative molybdenum carrier protein [Methyloceanibacter sp. wino2]|uniref:putative molybdenum carrier protein n=1 Tax=Methyloceanibacter sp. wino2 TaxID=2170729 RepID=UPI000D3E8205|nr:putative molybdenum carrier protein [Methyloceanibacter sp. wino2]
MVTVISGGQTGPDRAALEAAIATGTPHGGWCPKGGWAEDMPEPPGLLALYPNLRETPSDKPEQRTDWNVRDADALLVLVGQGGLEVSKGTERAMRHAKSLGRPVCVVSVAEQEADDRVRAFLSQFAGKPVCIAGPRESESPGLQAEALRVLQPVLQTLAA